MFVRRRTTLEEAWQYTSSQDVMPHWVKRCTTWRSDGLYLNRRSGLQRIEPTDWIIRDLDGDPLWLSQADFQKEYQVISV